MKRALAQASSGFGPVWNAAHSPDSAIHGGDSIPSKRCGIESTFHVLKVPMVAVRNILPSAADFKKSVGRYYLVQRLRRKRGWEEDLDKIAETLALFEPLRGVVDSVSPRAMELLRILRRHCANLLTQFELPSVEIISDLAQRVNFQIEAIVTRKYGYGNGRAKDLAALNALAARDNRIVLKDGGQQVMGKTVSASYNVERITKAHYPGDLQEKYAAYLKRQPNSCLGIDDYVEKIIKPLLQDDERALTMITTSVQPLRYVKYCNGDERLRYKIKLTGDGLLRWAHDDSLLDTSGMVSIETGPGWGIFVVDFAQDFYVNAHSKDEFHHSSFLAGGPVLSAGELCVSQGVLVGVTNKTGHYKSGPDELHRALLLLQKFDRKKGWFGGVGGGMEKIAVSDPFRAHGKWFSAEAVIAAGGNVGDPSLQAAVPMQQPTARNMEVLAEAVKPLLIF
jgi:hypothetical protein